MNAEAADAVAADAVAATRAKARQGEVGFRQVKSPRQALEVRNIRSLNAAVAGRGREAHTRDSAQRHTRASGQTRGNVRMRHSGGLRMRESGGQAPRIKLSASNPCKMRRIRVSKAQMSVTTPTSKAPTAARKVVRIMGRARNRAIRIMGRMRSKVGRIMDRMPNRVARTLQITTDPPGRAAPGTAAVRLVVGAATTVEW